MRGGEKLTARPDWTSVPNADPATTTEAVLSGAGAWPRDPVDARIVAGVRSRAGRLIDSQSEVGGWPELEAGAPRVDGDGDGMPDDWEGARGLDPADPTDGSVDPDGDGYTNLEDWLNSLA